MYKLQQSDLSKASAILGQSFHDYPLFEYIIPDSDYRREHLKYLCHFLLGLGLVKGEVLAPSSKIEGVSIWLPSSGPGTSGKDAMRAGLLNLFFRVNLQTMKRFMEIGDIKGKRRAEIIKGPYYLCDMIGVDPLFQRHGLGRKMIAARLLDFDKMKMRCYLETSRLENTTYYEQFGFTLIHKYRIRAVNVFCLLREPGMAKMS